MMTMKSKPEKIGTNYFKFTAYSTTHSLWSLEQSFRYVSFKIVFNLNLIFSFLIRLTKKLNKKNLFLMSRFAPNDSIVEEFKAGPKNSR